MSDSLGICLRASMQTNLFPSCVSPRWSLPRGYAPCARSRGSSLALAVGLAAWSTGSINSWGPRPPYSRTLPSSYGIYILTQSQSIVGTIARSAMPAWNASYQVPRTHTTYGGTRDNACRRTLWMVDDGMTGGIERVVRLNSMKAYSR